MQRLIRTEPLLDAINQYSWTDKNDKKAIENILLSQTEYKAYTEDEVLSILYHKEKIDSYKQDERPVWIKVRKRGIEYWSCPICGQEVQPTVYPRMNINRCPKCDREIFKEHTELKKVATPWWTR